MNFHLYDQIIVVVMNFYDGNQRVNCSYIIIKFNNTRNKQKKNEKYIKSHYQTLRIPCSDHIIYVILFDLASLRFIRLRTQICVGV